MQTMKRPATLAFLAGGACSLAAAFLSPAPVQAAENGIGFYLLGGRGPMAG